MKVETTRFGKVTFDESGIILFPEGIPGFTDQKRYVLLEVSEYAPLKWLQSIDEAWLAFVIVDPLDLLDEYNIHIVARNSQGLFGLEKS